MVALVQTPECFPVKGSVLSRLGIVGAPTAPPDHANCPVGQTTPGVMGGWMCPCKCHHRPTPLDRTATAEGADA